MRPARLSPLLSATWPRQVRGEVSWDAHPQYASFFRSGQNRSIPFFGHPTLPHNSSIGGAPSPLREHRHVSIPISASDIEAV